MPIPYGLILKGTVMRIGKDREYSRDAWGVECIFDKDFLYEEDYVNLVLKVTHSPNGWPHDVISLSDISHTNELIFVPNSKNMSNEEAAYLLKQD